MKVTTFILILMNPYLTDSECHNTPVVQRGSTREVHPRWEQERTGRGGGEGGGGKELGAPVVGGRRVDLALALEELGLDDLRQ